MKKFKRIKSSTNRFLKYNSKRIIFDQYVKIGEHYYGYVRIGNLLWTVENLYEPTPDFGNTSNTGSCWSGGLDASGNEVWNTDNSDGSGMLYQHEYITGENKTWLESMLPDGWRVPTTDDCRDLLRTMGVPEEDLKWSVQDNWQTKPHPELSKFLLDSRYEKELGPCDEYGFHGIKNGYAPIDHSTIYENWYINKNFGFHVKIDTEESLGNLCIFQPICFEGRSMAIFRNQNKAFRMPVRLCKRIDE